MPEITGATKLISDQIAIVVRLQGAVNDALDRNDSQSAQRLVTTLDQAFQSFLDGVQKMAIDVSGLKNALTSSSANADAIQSLTSRVAQIEQTLSSLAPEAIANLQTDVSDIKTALQELNTAATAPKTI